MSEIAEQIQNPVTSEPPLAEIPESSLREIPEQPPAPELSQPDGASQDEVALTAEIAQLWQIHNDFKTSLHQQSQNLRSLREELGKKLAEMKAMLAKPGRNGQWSSWLKQRHISRATADRLVTKHERSLHPEWNCLNGQFTEPTNEEIQNLLNKIAPKLRRVLRTPASSYRFIDLLSASLALDRKNTEEGFLVVKPGAHVTVEQPIPQELVVEIVPVIADLTAKEILESTGASMAS